MGVIPQTESVKNGLKQLSYKLQEKTDTFRKINDEKGIKTIDEIKKYLTEEDIYTILKELQEKNSKISRQTIADVLNIKSDIFNRMLKLGKKIVSDSKNIEEFKNNSEDKKLDKQKKEPKKEQKEKETSFLELLEAIKNLDKKITSLSQVLSQEKEEKKEYEYKDNEDNEDEESLDEELDNFPKRNYLFASRVNYAIYTLFMEIIEKKDLKIQRAINEAMLLYIRKYQ